jgi:hypothetical protein
MNQNGGANNDPFPPKIRLSIFDRDKGKCFYCHSIVGKPRAAAVGSFDGRLGKKEVIYFNEYEADHLVGAHDHKASNGVVSCRRCNGLKSNLTHTQFISKHGGKKTEGGGKIDKFVRCHGFVNVACARCTNPISTHRRLYCDDSTCFLMVYEE